MVFIFKKFLLLTFLLCGISGCKDESINHESVKIIATDRSALISDYERGLAKLPLNYSGVNVSEFYRVMNNARDRLRKTQFETTQDHKKRLNNEASEAIKPLSQENVYAFLMRDAKVTYDADKKKYLTHYACYELLLKGGVDCLVETLSKDLGGYVGENSFGVKAHVKEVREDKIYLRFNRASLKNNSFKNHDGFIYSLNLGCAATPEKALSLKDSEVSVLFVGKLTSPQLMNLDIEYLRPKISDYDPKSGKIFHEGINFELREIVCYAKRTGEIIDTKTFK